MIIIAEARENDKTQAQVLPGKSSRKEILQRLADSNQRLWEIMIWSDSFRAAAVPRFSDLGMIALSRTARLLGQAELTVWERVFPIARNGENAVTKLMICAGYHMGKQNLIDNRRNLWCNATTGGAFVCPDRRIQFAAD